MLPRQAIAVESACVPTSYLPQNLSMTAQHCTIPVLIETVLPIVISISSSVLAEQPKAQEIANRCWKAVRHLVQGIPLIDSSFSGAPLLVNDFNPQNVTNTARDDAPLLTLGHVASESIAHFVMPLVAEAGGQNLANSGWSSATLEALWKSLFHANVAPCTKNDVDWDAQALANAAWRCSATAMRHAAMYKSAASVLTSEAHEEKSQELSNGAQMFATTEFKRFFATGAIPAG